MIETIVGIVIVTGIGLFALARADRRKRSSDGGYVDSGGASDSGCSSDGGGDCGGGD